MELLLIVFGIWLLGVIAVELLVLYHVRRRQGLPFIDWKQVWRRLTTLTLMVLTISLASASLGACIIKQGGFHS